MFESLCFILGATVGSFLNVVVFRYYKESVVFPRSRCGGCGTQIAWYDNIPILSWLILKARCRQCRHRISVQYPLVELFAGLVAVSYYVRFGVSPQGVAGFTAVMLLVVIGLVDYRQYLIPLIPVFLLISVSIALSFYHKYNWEMVYLGASAELAFAVWFLPKVVGGVVGFAVMAAILIVSTFVARKTGRIGSNQSAMGWGDPILIAAIGAAIGWKGLPWAIAIGCTQGVLYFYVKQKFFPGSGQPEAHDNEIPDQSMPLGTFLSLGAIEIMLFWPAISQF